MIEEITKRFMSSAGQVDGNELAALFRADVGYLLSKLSNKHPNVINGGGDGRPDIVADLMLSLQQGVPEVNPNQHSDDNIIYCGYCEGSGKMPCDMCDGTGIHEKLPTQNTVSKAINGTWKWCPVTDKDVFVPDEPSKTLEDK